MARPRKEGLDYFPFDVYLDHKWESIEAMHDLVGFAICVKIFQECYKTVNGEIDFSDVIRRKTFEKRANITEELLNNILNTAADVELFDKKLWYESNIITSNGIKKRIDSVSKERKNARKRAESSYSYEKQTKNTRKSTQSKVKNSKEKEIKYTWKNSFEKYLEDCQDSYKKIIADEKWINQQSEFYPNVDIRLSLKKAYTNYWGTQSGWHHKKKKSIKGEINWKSTWANAIGLNRVFKQNRHGESDVGTLLSDRKL